MTTDREQHELAAKATGLAITWKEGWAAFIGNRHWRPKENDGDAFRLMVMLQLDVNVGQGNSCASWYPHKDWPNQPEPHLSDPFAATRLAIFRAAVEIGRSMP